MKLKDWLIFLLLGGIWSSSFLWIKIAVQEIGPVTLVAFRVLFGLLFGVLVIILWRVPLPRRWSDWMPLLFLGVINVAIPFFLISWGEQTIDSAVAAILDATVPLFAILIAHFALPDDKMTLPKVAGLLLGFVGVVVLMSKDLGAPAGSLLGQAAVVLASIFYAVGSVYARRHTGSTHGILRSVGPLLSSTVIMWIAAPVVESPFEVPRLSITWIGLLWLGIFGSGFAFILAYYLIHAIGPTRTTMVTYLFPLGGVLLGVGVLKELLTWQLIVGALLILASLAVANLPAKSSAAKE